MSEVMANINQVQQSAGRRPCHLSSGCHFLFVEAGVDSLVPPVLLHLDCTNMNRNPTISPQRCKRISEEHKQGVCVCVLQPGFTGAVHPTFTHLQELGADFKLRCLKSTLLRLCPPPLDSVKQLVNSPWDDALLLLAETHVKACSHGVRLPRASLKNNPPTQGALNRF